MKSWNVLLVILGMCATVFSDIPKTQEVCGTPNPAEMVQEVPDPQGWYNLYNGEDLTGWWINCNTSHRRGTNPGGYWWVENGVLFSDQAEGGSGGLLMTNRKYKDMEFEIEVFPDFGNDAGIFTRTNAQGKSWQVVVDYIVNKRVGGIWAEGLSGVGSYKYEPYKLDSETSVRQGGDANPPTKLWENGSAKWQEIWDPDGYNTIRVATIGRPPVIKVWISDVLVTDEQMTKQASNLEDSGYVALQIHGGTGSWSGGINKYKNVRIRELNPNGSPVLGPPDTTTPANIHTAPNPVRLEWSVLGQGLVELQGTLAGSDDYQLTIHNVSGVEVDNAVVQNSYFKHRSLLASGVHVVTLKSTGKEALQVTKKIFVP